MTWCAQLEDLEALIREELGAARASELRVHVASCPPCSEELALLVAEQTLFARRAEAMPGLERMVPFAGVALAVARSARGAVPEDREVREADGGIGRAPAVLVALGRIARRGHFSVACAAALFLCVGVSRLGAPAATMTMSDEATAATTDEDEATTTTTMTALASFDGERELLACSAARGDGVSEMAVGRSGASAEALACGDDVARSAASNSCEPGPALLRATAGAGSLPRSAAPPASTSRTSRAGRTP